MKRNTTVGKEIICQQSRLSQFNPSVPIRVKFRMSPEMQEKISLHWSVTLHFLQSSEYEKIAVNSWGTQKSSLLSLSLRIIKSNNRLIIIETFVLLTNVPVISCHVYFNFLSTLRRITQQSESLSFSQREMKFHVTAQLYKNKRILYIWSIQDYRQVLRDLKSNFLRTMRLLQQCVRLKGLFDIMNAIV